MLATKVTEQYPLFLPAPKTPRSTGVHVSALIRCIATETGFLKPQWAEELSLVDVREIKDPIAVLRINIGLAWEEHYIRDILSEYGVVDHPTELSLDGVYLTHDGESVSVVVTLGRLVACLVCHEIKATYKSTKTVGDLTTQWLWITQLKAYCKALNTTKAMLHVLFLCGDYSFPITPVREVWEIEFTPEEIEENWNLLVDYRDYRLSREDTDATT